MNKKYVGKAKPLLLGCVLLLCGACAARSVTAPPALMTPVGVVNDTAKVTRGHVERFEQYKAFVRMLSKEMYFSSTGLAFGEYACTVGQQVKKGDLLVRLDTKPLEEQIENQQQNIVNLRAEHAYENERIALDISIAQVELMRLTRDAADSGPGNDAQRMAVERKKLDIQRLQLSLQQTQERQTLTLTQAQKSLTDLQQRVANASLYAPFDGKIMYLESKQPGDNVAAFQPLIYITDEQTCLVEFQNFLNIQVTQSTKLKGLINGEPVALQWIPLDKADSLFYAKNRQSPPIRFNVPDYAGKLNPGDYAYVFVYTSGVEDVLRVPINTLYNDAELGDYVYLMIDGHKVLQQVEVGLRSISFVEIKSGLQEGDEVFVKQ